MHDPVRVPSGFVDGIYQAADDSGRLWQLTVRFDHTRGRHLILDPRGRQVGVANHQPPYQGEVWHGGRRRQGPIAEALRKIMADPDATRRRRYGRCVDCGCTTWSEAALASGLGSQHRREHATGGSG